MSGKRMMQRMLSRHENRNAKQLTKPLDMQAEQKFPNNQRSERIMYICRYRRVQRTL